MEFFLIGRQVHPTNINYNCSNLRIHKWNKVRVQEEEIDIPEITEQKFLFLKKEARQEGYTKFVRNE